MLPLGFGTAQVKEAVTSGKADLGLTGTTDATLADMGLVIIEDDKGLQLADNLVPVVGKDFADDADLAAALNALADQLTTEDLASLNKKVDGERQKAADVAKEFLTVQGPALGARPATVSLTTARRPHRGGELLAMRAQHTELVAIRIGHHDPADLALADVDAGRPEGDEPVDLRLLVAVDGRSEVEVQPVLPGLRRHRRPAPGDLRTAVRRADRGLLVLVPDQRPAQRLAPEVPDLLRAVADSAPMKPQSARKLLPGSITQNSLPSGSASTM